MAANWDPPFLGLFLLLFAVVAALAWAIPQGDRRWWWLAALLAGLVAVGLGLGEGWMRGLLVEAAGFVAVALVWSEGTLEASRAARRFLQLLIVSTVCLAAGLLLVGTGRNQPPLAHDLVAVGLLAVGFGLKLALVPFYFWLPGVAATAQPMTTLLIVGVVDIAAFLELAHLRVTHAWVIADWQGLWLALAFCSMLGGALLALAQQDVKRMLAFSTIDDMGYLLVGVVAGPGIGLSGALLGAVSHALMKALLFGAVAVAEGRDGLVVTLKSRGLAATYPVSAGAFILGALGMIGVPPTFGFAGRWRLYLAGVEHGGAPFLLGMLLATSLAVLYYARTIHRVWLGHSAGSDARGEPHLAVVVLLILMALALLLGLFPGWLAGQFS